MTFALSYYNGWVVNLVAFYLPWNRQRYFPLRNFGDRQGDARIFKEVDCPSLTDSELRILIKSYNPKIVYQRINSKRFIKV